MQFDPCRHVKEAGVKNTQAQALVSEKDGTSDATQRVVQVRTLRTLKTLKCLTALDKSPTTLAKVSVGCAGKHWLSDQTNLWQSKQLSLALLQPPS